MRQAVYLDNYYYYAPVPRVLRLRELYWDVLRGADVLLVQRGLLRRDTVAARIVELHSNDVAARLLGRSGHIPGGRRRLNLLSLAQAPSLDEELLLILDFIVFYAQHDDPYELGEKLEALNCPDDYIVELTPAAARRASKLLRSPEELAAHPNILRLIRLYAVCRAARLLGFTDPHHIEYIEVYRVSGETSAIVRRALEDCRDACGYKGGRASHAADAESIKQLMEHARLKGYRVLAASLASIGVAKPRTECFACLADFASRDPSGILLHLTPGVRRRGSS